MSTLDDWVARELAISKPEVRFTDMAIVLRRLTLDLAPGVKLQPGAQLCSKDGTEWQVAPSYDEAVAVSTVDKRAAARYGQGLPLYTSRLDDCPAAVLRVETIVAAGGRWDNLKKDWQTDAEGRRVAAQSPLVVTVRESQVEVVRWWAAWLQRMRVGAEQQQQGALIFGDRRGGKTWIGLLCIVAALIDVPKIGGSGTIAWLVSVDHPSRAELDREFRETIPGSWWRYQEQPTHTYTLANNTKLTHRTAEDAEALRNGRVDLALCNELGRFAKLAFENVLNALADKDGAFLGTSNRPRRSKANFVVKLAKDAQADKAAGKVPVIEFFQVDPRLNDALAKGAKGRIKGVLQRLDPDEPEEGDLVEVGDFCYCPPWDEIAHLRPRPELPDITRRVSRMICGSEKDWILGADFQGRPAVCGVAFKVFGSLPDGWILWCDRAFWVEHGDEDDLADAFEADNYAADNSLIIADASSAWQSHDHRPGPDSFSYFKARRYIIQPATKKAPGSKAKYAPNPRPKELAVSRVNGLLRELRPGGYRALMVNDDDIAKPMATSFRKCKAVKGRYGVVPGGDHSHLTDAALYVVWAVLSALRPGEVRAQRSARPNSAPRFDPNARPEIQ